MQLKKEIDSNLHLYCAIDDKRKTYSYEQELIRGQKDTRTLDGDVEIINVAEEVSLHLTVTGNVTVYGKISGTLTVICQGKNTGSVTLGGGIADSGNIRVYHAKECIIDEKVDGQVVVKNNLTIKGDLGNTAKITGDAVRIEGLISEESFVKAAYQLQYDLSLNPTWKNFKAQSIEQLSEFADENQQIIPQSPHKRKVITIEPQKLEEPKKIKKSVFPKSTILPIKKILPVQKIEDLKKEESDSDSFADELQAILMQQSDEENFDDISDTEIDKYIDPGFLSTSKNQQSFETQRYQMVEHFCNFISKNIKNNEVPLPKDAEEKLILRKHQIEMLEALKSLIQADGTTGYFDCATGAGKTILFIVIYLALGRPKTLILESRIGLIHQTIAEFKKYLPDCDIGIFDGTHNDTKNNIIISTYPSLQNQFKNPSRQLKPGDIRLLIADEAHNALGDGRYETIMEFFSSAFALGLTATPKFNLKVKGSLQGLDQLFQNLIYHYPTKRAIEEGMLAPCENIHVYIPNIEALPNVKKKNNTDSQEDFSERQLSAQLNVDKMNRVPVLLYANGVSKATGKRILGESAVVFAVGIDNANKIAAEFNKYLKDHPYFQEHSKLTPAVAVSSDTKPAVLQKIYKRFKKGKIKVLVNDKLCSEGCDIPAAKTIINVKPTKSDVEGQQRNGRGSRLLGNQVWRVIDIIYPNLDQITFDKYLGNQRTCGITQIKLPEEDVMTYPPLHIPENEVEELKVLHDDFIILKSVPDCDEQNITSPSSPESYKASSIFKNLVIPPTIADDAPDFDSSYLFDIPRSPQHITNFFLSPSKSPRIQFDFDDERVEIPLDSTKF